MCGMVGIGGLEDHILKSAALSSTVACPAFTDLHQEATPIVRVAIEPRSMSKFSADLLQLGVWFCYMSSRPVDGIMFSDCPSVCVCWLFVSR